MQHESGHVCVYTSVVQLSLMSLFECANGDGTIIGSSNR